MLATMMNLVRLLPAVLLALLLSAPASANPDIWRIEWPDTDFEQSSVDFIEIMSGGPPKDGIPSIDDPQFVPVASAEDLAEREPVIGLTLGGEAKAYPLRVLTWHEIVNDEIGGVPVAVTYCPLCNAAIVFDRRVEVDGATEVLEFGTTGKLRRSDLVMYDRTTESWWQQFLGEAIVGSLTGTQLAMLPARLESWERFKAANPDGQVLVPNNEGMRSYGRNPYVGYDSASRPFLYRGDYPDGIEPMAYVVAVGDQAWSLEKLKQAGSIESGELTLAWESGLASALDTEAISEGRDIGNVTVQRKGDDGQAEDVVYDLTFAFVFHAFRPEGTIHK